MGSVDKFIFINFENVVGNKLLENGDFLFYLKKSFALVRDIGVLRKRCSIPFYLTKLLIFTLQCNEMICDTL